MPTPEERLTFAVPDKGEVSGVYARPTRAFATIVVAHGAGAGMDHPFMSGFTRAMNDEGAATLRFNFPYIERGSRSTDRAPVAVDAWRAAFEAAVTRAKADEPVWASGKSFGGRMASMAVTSRRRARWSSPRTTKGARTRSSTRPRTATMLPRSTSGRRCSS